MSANLPPSPSPWAAPPREPLPIDPLLPDVIAALAAGGAVVVEAPPGAGKTTRVPRALLDAGLAEAGEVLVLEPRRLPARLAAARVAAELGERPGGTVGYAVRFEEVSGPRTRLRFVTEGILLRRLLAEPALPGVAAVVLDELHERHLATDLALALLVRARREGRSDLKLCAMSATLDSGPVRALLDDCPLVRSEGRRFDVALEHLALPDDRPLPVQVAAGVRRALRELPRGDVLVFLPGAAEIRRVEEALGAAPGGGAGELLVLALHGDLSLEAQARAVAPAPPGRRKVILSTNVAETSVTIDGVVAVVDTGLARIAAHSPWTGLPTLSLAKISQSSAIQRAGRAGRTQPGTAYRLYTRADFEGRRAHDLPEIARLDLTEAMLTLRALGVDGAGALDWLTPPPAAAVDAAEVLLRRLGAVDPGGALTARGRRMLRFPVHPRLARLLVEAEDRGLGPDGAALAALIAERDVRARDALGPRRDGRRDDGGVDLLVLDDLFRQARAAGLARDRLRALGLDPHAAATAEKARRQLAGLARAPAAPRPPAASSPAARDEALARAVLAGFPDRVARRRAAGERTVLLSAGGTAELAYEPGGDFIVAVDAEERTRDRGRGVTVRLGCDVAPEWLLDSTGDGAAGDLKESDTLEWDAASERVVRRERLAYGALALDETVRPAAPSAEASRLLADAAIARGADSFDEPGALERLAARLETVAAAHPELAIPRLDPETLRQTLAGACDGLTSMNELRATGMVERVRAALPADVQARLRAEAPDSVVLPGGRTVQIRYTPGQPPWIESRLQDFFGMTETPAIAGGRTPLTVHLLAPNGRAVQVTRDLDSFWRQHYPALRRQLSRRYPKHAWAEDGRTAKPPPPLPPRRR